MKKKNVKKKTIGREILEWILTIVAAVVIALPLRAFAFEMVRVDGSSMNGTLSSGEIMFVTKFDYASTWLSLPWWDDKGKEAASRITTGGDPKRFDVVVCRYPGRGDTNFVKRVVGLPGDTVELRQGYLYVNGERYEEPYILDEYRGGSLNNFGPYEVPEGEFFVMGDHRNNSNDSRSQGSLPRNMIIGHARTVLYPFSGIRGIE
ncbi:signal peptidase I [Aristaeella lactis]|uniref:signal peptidase I n=1 Tax=Aristaeella lactis TaxID=3046383 RepID=UPI0015C47FCA|nr:signal peptidase I [Aristaeella lactis]QUA51883.1 signal peptidase I [Aristaeella lactis]